MEEVHRCRIPNRPPRHGWRMACAGLAVPCASSAVHERGLQPPGLAGTVTSARLRCSASVVSRRRSPTPRRDATWFEGATAHRRQRRRAHRDVGVPRRGRRLRLGRPAGREGGPGGRGARGPVRQDGHPGADRRAPAHRVDEREGRHAQQGQLHAVEPGRAPGAVRLSRRRGHDEPGAGVRRGAGLRAAERNVARRGALPDVRPGHRRHADCPARSRSTGWAYRAGRADRGRRTRGGRGARRPRGRHHQDLGRRPGRHGPEAGAERLPGDHRRGARPRHAGGVAPRLDQRAGGREGPDPGGHRRLRAHRPGPRHRRGVHGARPRASGRVDHPEPARLAGDARRPAVARARRCPRSRSRTCARRPSAWRRRGPARSSSCSAGTWPATARRG